MTSDRLPALALLVSGVLCAFLGVRLLIADVSAWQAARFINDWTERREVASDQAWVVAESAAQRAIAFAPVAFAIHYDRLGRIYEWRHLHLPFGNEAAVESRLAARDAYKQTLQLRPLWPYTWARHAYIKLRLWQIDEEFDLALRKATELGPWRAGVNKTVAEIGFISWQALDADQRMLILEAAKRVIQQNPKTGMGVIALAKKLHRLADLCAVFENDVPKECL